MTEECDDENQRNGDGCDEGCHHEDHDGCDVPVLALNGTELVNLMGTTTGAMNDIFGTQQVEWCPTAPTGAPDVIYAVKPAITGKLTATSVAHYQKHVLHIRDACGNTTGNLGCDTDMNAYVADTATANVTAGNVVYVVVDGYGMETGNFSLTLQLQ